VTDIFSRKTAFHRVRYQVLKK